MNPIRILFVAAVLLTPSVWAGEPKDSVADRVFGQPDLTSDSANADAVSAVTLNMPFGVAVAPDGRIYVSDSLNHRVLGWPSGPDYRTGDAPDLVIGQPDFTSHAENAGGLSASSLFFPFFVAVDADLRLYVADSGNNRVLVFENPAETDVVADFVFGQPDFMSGAANNGGISASSLDRPVSIAFGPSGSVYVGDATNSRVLGFASPLTTDSVADVVLGQPGFNSGVDNNGGLSDVSLLGPTGVAVDADGNVWVADSNNSRVLTYDDPFTNDAAADRVIGQTSFTSTLFSTTRITIPHPEALWLDAEGRLYLSDSSAQRALQYEDAADLIPNLPEATEVFGQSDFVGVDVNEPNGFVGASGLNLPFGLATDAAGNLYVADAGNNRVVVYDAPRAGSFGFETTAVTVGEFSGSVVLTVLRTDGVDGEVAVDYATSDGTALAGDDYTAASGTLTFADGESSKTITIDVTEDETDEDAESFTVALAGAATATVTIQDGTVVVTESSKDSSGGCSLVLER